jgi:5-hydroxyisourate hydrolase
MTGRLTTHVLDTANGRPAAGIEIELWRRVSEPDEWELIVTITTNVDGRTEQPLLTGDAFVAGTYELFFGAGDYFNGCSGVSSPPFLDRVPVRFSITDPSQHYHVPLLISPWAYSTYRGS